MKQIIVWHRKKILEAIDRLLYHYEGIKPIDYCGLCNSFLNCVHSDYNWQMSSCPWIAFEGEKCHAYAGRIIEGFVPAQLFSWTNPVWVKDSVARLKRWKKLIEGQK
jgi:hypothetical protein